MTNPHFNTEKKVKTLIGNWFEERTLTNPQFLPTPTTPTLLQTSTTRSDYSAPPRPSTQYLKKHIEECQMLKTATLLATNDSKPPSTASSTISTHSLLSSSGSNRLFEPAITRWSSLKCKSNMYHSNLNKGTQNWGKCTKFSTPIQ
ncbi:hypothetical protein RCL1_004461 [Eukaryota sp. TZLM3-RCL]